MDTNIPMLLSRSAMKKAGTCIDFVEDKVTMLGQKQNVVVTSSGHYSLVLNDNKKVLEDTNSQNTKVTLHVKQEYSTKDVALKLHSQFFHPPPERLIKLVRNSSWPDKKPLIEMIHRVSSDCTICKEYKHPSPRPVVGFSMATEFNDVVAMDLKFFQGEIILHLIDHTSRFSAAALLKSK